MSTRVRQTAQDWKSLEKESDPQGQPAPQMVLRGNGPFPVSYWKEMDFTFGATQPKDFLVQAERGGSGLGMGAQGVPGWERYLLG